MFEHIISNYPRDIAGYIAIHTTIWAWLKFTQPLKKRLTNEYKLMMARHVKRGHKAPFMHCKPCARAIDLKQQYQKMAVEAAVIVMNP